MKIDVTFVPSLWVVAVWQDDPPGSQDGGICDEDCHHDDDPLGGDGIDD